MFSELLKGTTHTCTHTKDNTICNECLGISTYSIRTTDFKLPKFNWFQRLLKKLWNKN